MLHLHLPTKLLSKDISTEFRGRGDVIQIYPLSFKEYATETGIDKREAYDEYMMYGGMPYLTHLDSDEEKLQYLADLFEEIYFKDIEERYQIKLPGILREMTSELCSSVGSLTNASKLSRTIKSSKNIQVDSETISSYLRYLQDAFLFSEAARYDVKGKKYFEYPSKYYCTDIGLRNARLGLRQMEETHIMENVIYNELLVRGYTVDVGVIAIRDMDTNNKIHQKNCEIEYIIVDGSSTDGTMDIVNKYRGHITTIVSEPDKGIYDAMNKGIKLAHGHWINFINAGDIYNNDLVLSNFIPAIDDSTVIAYGDTKMKYSVGVRIWKPFPLELMRKQMCFGHPSTFVRTSYHKQNLFDTSYKSSADYKMLFDAYYKDKVEFQYIPQIVADFEAEGGISSTNILLVARENARLQGVNGTLKWKLTYCFLCAKQFVKKFIPQKMLDARKQRKIKELQKKCAA